MNVSCNTCGKTAKPEEIFCKGCGGAIGENLLDVDYENEDGLSCDDEPIFHVDTMPNEEVIFQAQASIPPKSRWNPHTGGVATLTSKRIVFNKDKISKSTVMKDAFYKLGKELVEIYLEDVAAIETGETTPRLDNPSKRIAWPNLIITTKEGDVFQFLFTGVEDIASGNVPRNTMVEEIKKLIGVTAV